MRSGAEGQFRLSNKTAAGPGADAGILEVFHAGAWGTLCEGSFGLNRVRHGQLMPVLISTTWFTEHIMIS